MNITDASIYAPSVRQMVKDMSAVLLERRKSLFVLTPRSVAPADIWDLLRSELGIRAADIRDLFLAESDQLPLSTLAMAFVLPENTAINQLTIDTLLANAEGEGNLPDILYLDQFDALSPEQRELWVTFIEHWAHAMRRRANQGQKPIALCAIGHATTATSHLPLNSQMIEIHSWWGVPSIIETRLLCRSQTTAGDCRGVWREHVLPPITGGDVELMAFLWDAITDDWATMTNHLLEYGESRGWNATKLREWGAESVCAYRNQHEPFVPPHQKPELQPLWAHGAIQWTTEYGIELNIAALVHLGRKDIVCYRVWRGQVQYVLPFVNSLRLAACDRLAEVYGARWPENLVAPDDEGQYTALLDDPSSCEFVHLKTILASRDKHANWNNWKILIDRAMTIRNELAHYRPITYAAFEEVWNLRKRVP